MRTAFPCLVAVLLAACSSGSGSSTGAGGGGGASSASTTGSASSASTTGSATSASSASGGAPDTWTSYAQGFFATYCVECHNPADAARDYNKLADVQKDSVNVRCGVAPAMLAGCAASPPPKQFPISDASGTNPKPSDAERDRIVAWIEAGLPQ